MENLQTRCGISVMPESIFFIGGEVMQELVKEEKIGGGDVPRLGYQFLCCLKQNLLTITAKISSIYEQSIEFISIDTAHDLAFEYLYDLAVEVLKIKPKKTEWEALKEDQAASPTLKAILTAVENATENELISLYGAYPKLVDAFMKDHLKK